MEQAPRGRAKLVLATLATPTGIGTNGHRPLDLTAVPQELRQLPQWLPWKLVPSNARPKPLKIPICLSGTPADTTKPEMWDTFDHALAAYDANAARYAGVGFLFTSLDPYIGIDLDNCIDPDSNIADWALDIIEKFNSYTEVSPSGTGVKIFVRSSWLPAKGGKRGNIEIYGAGRYFTVTGRRILGGSEAVEDRTQAVTELFTELFGSTDQLATTDTSKLAPAPLPKDFLEKLRAKNLRVAQRIESEDAAVLAGADLVEIMFDRSSRVSGARVDRSRNDAYIAVWLVGNGYTPEETLAVLTHPIWFSGSKYRETGNENYPRLTVVHAVQAVTERRRRLDAALMDCTEMGNAERLITQFGNNLRYSTLHEGWLLWTGTNWTRDELDQTNRWLHEAVRSIRREAADATDVEVAKTLLKWARQSEDSKRLNGALKIAATLDGVKVAPGQLDQHTMLFPVQNGIIDLTTGDLLPHARHYYFTSTSPVIYDPDAPHDRWDEFLLKVFSGDQELIRYVQRLVGYTLTGLVSEHVVVFLYGSGANGKSTFIMVLQHLLSQYCRRISREAITASPHGSSTLPDQAAARLIGARMGVVSETERNMKLAEAWVKDITGGETVATKILYHNYSEAQMTAKLWIVGNHKPRVMPGREDDDNDSMWRRLREIPFLVQIPREERVLDYHNMLITNEASGILAWAVEGCLDWQREGLGRSQSVDAATAEYRSEMDSLKPFIDTWLERGDRCYVNQSEVYKAYVLWAIEEGEAKIAKRELKKRLEERGFTKGRRDGYDVWVNCKLRQPLPGYLTD